MNTELALRTRTQIRGNANTTNLLFLLVWMHGFEVTYRDPKKMSRKCWIRKLSTCVFEHLFFSFTQSTHSNHLHKPCQFLLSLARNITTRMLRKLWHQRSNTGTSQVSPWRLMNLTKSRNSLNSIPPLLWKTSRRCQGFLWMCKVSSQCHQDVTPASRRGKSCTRSLCPSSSKSSWSSPFYLLVRVRWV